MWNPGGQKLLSLCNDLQKSEPSVYYYFFLIPFVISGIRLSFVLFILLVGRLAKANYFRPPNHFVSNQCLKIFQNPKISNCVIWAAALKKKKTFLH